MFAGGDVKEISRAINKNASYALYLLVEGNCDRITDYFVSHGIDVLFSADKLETIKAEVLMDTKPFILVVIESGTGQFSNIVFRKDVVDLLGIANEDKQQHVILFYTDGYLKSDVSKMSGINLLKYEGTGYVLDVISDLQLQLEKPEHSIVKRVPIDIESLERADIVDYDPVENAIESGARTEEFIKRMRRNARENDVMNIPKMIINEGAIGELGEDLDRFKLRV